jgi:4-alpha-glucanotransferase
MSDGGALAELAGIAGIFPEFHDLQGVLRPTSVETLRALLRADGLPADSDAEAEETLRAVRAERDAAIVTEDIIVRAGQADGIDLAEGAEWRIVGEDDALVAEGRSAGRVELPPLSPGVHSLHITQVSAQQSVNLIAAPAGVPRLDDLVGRDRVWGMMAALYGLRSERNGGLGDFRDLADLAVVLGAEGAAFLGINPVHALGWADQHTISPYSPTHRGFLNPLHCALDDIPGLAYPAPSDAGSGEMIDHAAHQVWKREGLRRGFDAFNDHASPQEQQSFAAFVTSGGAALTDFARFEAMSLRHGPDWRQWPKHINCPDGEERFHLWLQWTADRQLGAAQKRAQEAGMGLGLYLDLAVGARLGGAESWSAQASLAKGVSLGAPPDQLSPAGQNWQLAAYAPRKLACHAYAPLRHVLAQSMRHCGVLRIDHALGLNRSYWIPDDGSPGGYIRQNFRAFMAIIAIEAQRAGTIIIGEDLGLVPEGFRDTMAAAGLYGYTVLQYEKNEHGRFRRPQELRAAALACFGTHDTPTLRGFWEGHDIDWWERLGWTDGAAANAARARREDEKRDLLSGAEATSMADGPEVADVIHSALADAPSALAAVQLDDVLQIREAQNLPGTVDEHPNWRRRYPATVAEIAANDCLHRTAGIMAAAGRRSTSEQTERDIS